MRNRVLPTVALLTLLGGTCVAFAAPQVTNKDVDVKGGPVKSETLKFQAFNGELALPHSAQRLYTGRSAYRDTTSRNVSYRSGRIGYVRGEPGVRYGQRGYAPLVGDSESGLGFYRLPEPYRAGAERYRYAHSFNPPNWYWRYAYGNPVQQAVVADAIRTPAFTPASAVNGYRYGVFDPIDGVGTPFFGGYYSAGTE